MDSVSIFTGVFVIGIFLLIFIIPSVNTKRKEKKMLHTLTKMAEQQHCIITKTEIIGDSVLALDEKNAVIFFLRQLKDQQTTEYIQLNDILVCNVLNQAKSFKNKGADYKQIERLGLQFVCIDKSKQNIIWEFYNIEDSMHMNIELKRLEEWKSIVNARLKIMQK